MTRSPLEDEDSPICVEVRYLWWFTWAAVPVLSFRFISLSITLSRSAGQFLAKICCLLDAVMQNGTSLNAGVKGRLLTSSK